MESIVSRNTVLRNSGASALLVGLLVASSCAIQREKGPTPPQPQAGFRQVGLASFYDSDFQGKRTASGESFNQNSLTAAHRSLPFGTRVKVRNLDNGKSVIVRINDRGPFRKGRIIDLSLIAAQQLGLMVRGLARVEVMEVGAATSAVEANPVAKPN